MLIIEVYYRIQFKNILFLIFLPLEIFFKFRIMSIPKNFPHLIEC